MGRVFQGRSEGMTQSFSETANRPIWAVLHSRPQGVTVHFKPGHSSASSELSGVAAPWWCQGWRQMRHSWCPRGADWGQRTCRPRLKCWRVKCLVWGALIEVWGTTWPGMLRSHVQAEKWNVSCHISKLGCHGHQ